MIAVTARQRPPARAVTASLGAPWKIPRHDAGASGSFKQRNNPKTTEPKFANIDRAPKFLRAASIVAIALIASLPLPFAFIGTASAERGDMPGTKDCLKVLRRDGNYLVCPNADGTKSVYKLPSLIRR